MINRSINPNRDTQIGRLYRANIYAKSGPSKNGIIAVMKILDSSTDKNLEYRTSTLSRRKNYAKFQVLQNHGLFSNTQIFQNQSYERKWKKSTRWMAKSNKRTTGG